MAAQYSLDTSMFIDSWRRHYPPDVFPGLWDRLADLIDQGDALASEEVLFELEKQEDEILDWVGARTALFVSSDDSVWQAARGILATHPRLIDTRKNRSGADPFVIAVAQTKGCAVVTYETPTNNPQRPHIPDVCGDLSIHCIGVVDLIREQGWQMR